MGYYGLHAAAETAALCPSHLQPPPGDPRELCGEALLSGRRSRTTRGRELVTAATVSSAGWARPVGPLWI